MPLHFDPPFLPPFLPPPHLEGIAFLSIAVTANGGDIEHPCPVLDEGAALDGNVQVLRVGGKGGREGGKGGK